MHLQWMVLCFHPCRGLLLTLLHNCVLGPVRAAWKWHFTEGVLEQNQHCHICWFQAAPEGRRPLLLAPFQAHASSVYQAACVGDVRSSSHSQPARALLLSSEAGCTLRFGRPVAGSTGVHPKSPLHMWPYKLENVHRLHFATLAPPLPHRLSLGAPSGIDLSQAPDDRVPRRAHPGLQSWVGRSSLPLLGH